MAGPFIVFLAGLATAYLAVVSNDGLVDDDYYKQGLAVNRMRARDQNATRLGLQADVMQATANLSIRVLLQGNVGTALPEILQLRITHPTRSGMDQEVVLHRSAGAAYAGFLNVALVGRWHIALEDEKHEWRLTGDWAVEKESIVHLPVGSSK